MADTTTVVLVEGESDRLAIEAAAVRCGADLVGNRVDVVAMGGATNIGRYLTLYAALLAGALDAHAMPRPLCDLLAHVSERSRA